MVVLETWERSHHKNNPDQVSVYNVFVERGNVAVLQCGVPASVRDSVEVSTTIIIIGVMIVALIIIFVPANVIIIVIVIITIITASIITASVRESVEVRTI